MKRSFYYLLRIFYANDQQSKYPGNSYFMALFMATFLIMAALLLVILVAFCLSPGFYKFYLMRSSRIDARWEGAVFLALTFSLLRILVREDDLSDPTLEKTEVRRVINITIFSTLAVFCIALAIAVKVLQHHQHAMGFQP
jgi:hypothetical protein